MKKKSGRKKELHGLQICISLVTALVGKEIYQILENFNAYSRAQRDGILRDVISGFKYKVNEYSSPMDVVVIVWPRNWPEMAYIKFRVLKENFPAGDFWFLVDGSVSACHLSHNPKAEDGLALTFKFTGDDPLVHLTTKLETSAESYNFQQ